MLYWFLPKRMQISQKCTSVPSLLSLPPMTPLSYPTPLGCQSTRSELHASYSNFPLAICFNMVMYMFQSYSQFIPPSPSLAAPTSLFSVCVSISCAANGFISTISLAVVIQLLSHARLFVTPWTISCQVHLSMEFHRQEDWNGVLFPSPGDLPNPGIKSTSPALAGGFFITKPPGKPTIFLDSIYTC